MKSKITGGATQALFSTRVLGKYEVSYFQCLETGFIQTEEPYWLNEAYSEAITKLDVGLAYRNTTFSTLAEKLILKNFNPDGKFLDYAGGYGLFTRMMRDKGFDFYNTDKYCQNLFAEYFDLKQLSAEVKFELVTAFEVFEHLSDPYPEIEAILKYADNLLFTSELQPVKTPAKVKDWWYFIPETGQHVAFYNQASLEYIARKLGFRFYSDGISLHLFTKTNFDHNPLIFERDPFLIRKLKKLLETYENNKFPKRESLLQADWLMIKEKLKEAYRSVK